MQHHSTTTAPATPAKPTHARLQTVLDQLFTRQMLSEQQHKMGLMLAEDYFYGILGGESARISQIYRAEPVLFSQGQNLTPLERHHHARKRYHKAMASLAPILGQIANIICCEDIGLSESETLLGLPRRSAKIPLTAALDQLALFYGTACSKR